MQVKKTSSQSALAVSLSEAKDHLRVEQDDTDFDTDIEALILAAQDYVESETHQTVITSTFEATYNGFPVGPLYVPGWPITSVISITYLDELGNPAGVDEFQVDLTQSPVMVCPMPGAEWPVTQEGSLRPVTVQFQAGYGSSDTSTPPMLKAMIKLLVAHWFKNREAISNKGVVTTYPLAFEALRDQVRVNEFVQFRTNQRD